MLFLAAENIDAVCRVVSRHARVKVEVQELVVKGTSIWNCRSRSWADGEGLERVDPFEGEFGHENGHIGAFFYISATTMTATSTENSSADSYMVADTTRLIDHHSAQLLFHI